MQNTNNNKLVSELVPQYMPSEWKKAQIKEGKRARIYVCLVLVFILLSALSANPF